MYGLAAEYIFNDPRRSGSEEENASGEHLMTVLKGVGIVVFAVVGLFLGWF